MDLVPYQLSNVLPLKKDVEPLTIFYFIESDVPFKDDRIIAVGVLLLVNISQAETTDLSTGAPGEDDNASAPICFTSCGENQSSVW